MQKGKNLARPTINNAFGVSQHTWRTFEKKKKKFNPIEEPNYDTITLCLTPARLVHSRVCLGTDWLPKMKTNSTIDL